MRTGCGALTRCDVRSPSRAAPSTSEASTGHGRESTPAGAVPGQATSRAPPAGISTVNALKIGTELFFFCDFAAVVVEVGSQAGFEASIAVARTVMRRFDALRTVNAAV